MMTDLYLIAHKVRNEPAFDIATRMDCPECNSMTIGHDGCNECDSLGYWWIITTSGHRAYPWWTLLLNIEEREAGMFLYHSLGDGSISWDQIDWPMPPNLPDHYPTALAPDAPKRDLAGLLGLRKPKPSQPFPRRI